MNNLIDGGAMLWDATLKKKKRRRKAIALLRLKSPPWGTSSPRLPQPPLLAYTLREKGHQGNGESVRYWLALREEFALVWRKVHLGDSVAVRRFLIVPRHCCVLPAAMRATGRSLGQRHRQATRRPQVILQQLRNVRRVRSRYRTPVVFLARGLPTM